MRSFVLTLAGLALLACAVLGDEGAVDLTVENFKEKTAEGFWFVKFYAPWCGHCKKLAPTWEHLGKELAGKANIGKVDCTQHRDICSQFDVKGFPTLKLLENGEEKEKYAGARSASSFVKFLQDKAGLDSSVSVKDLDPPAAAPPKQREAPPAEPAGPSEATELTKDNFAELTKEGYWFIKFYAPWCGHCKKLAPTWEHVAKHTKGKSGGPIAKVDCTAHGDLCRDHGVKGYPTLKLFKDGEEVEKYQGGRDADALVKFLKQKGALAEDATVPKFVAEAAAAKPAAKKAEAAAAEQKEEGPSDVVTLTDETFAQTKEGNWLIKFYAPWCGHCKRLAPTWNELATKVNLNKNRKVTIAKVDCTSEKTTCKDQGVRGYPTLKLFKDGDAGTQYQGGRDLGAFVSYLSNLDLLAGDEPQGKDEL